MKTFIYNYFNKCTNLLHLLRESKPLTNDTSRYSVLQFFSPYQMKLILLKVTKDVRQLAHPTSLCNLSRLCYSRRLLVYCVPGPPPAEQVIRGEGNLQRQHYSGPTTANTTSSPSSNPRSAISSTCNLMSSRQQRTVQSTTRGARLL